jgi:hypothetical protein
MGVGKNCLAWGALLLLSAPAGAKPPEKVDFAHDIAPLIQSRCAQCHTNGKYKSHVSFDTREAAIQSKAIVPGRSNQSSLIERITSADPESRMPLNAKPLTADEIALFKTWIDQGATWTEGFTFKKTRYVPPLRPRRPKIDVKDDSNPIDVITQDYFKRNHLNPPAALDDVAFIRRVYLDLIGLLPAPLEVQRFLKDRSPAKRTELVRRLLAENRSYADHWLTFWNDLLRNDYQGTGYIDGGRTQITEWLYKALALNKPYDQFVRELIDPKGDSDGFIRGIKWRGRVNASQTPELQFSQNISQVFFGINMKCASCHDSFIDSWKLDDAYGLAAISAEGPLEIYRCDKPTGKKAAAHFVFPELGQIDGSLTRQKRLEQLARLITEPENGRFTRTIANRIWQRLMGRGIVHPVDVMANPPWSDDLLDYLGVYLVDQHYDLKKLIELIVTSRTYQSQAVLEHDEPQGEEYVFRGPEMKRLTAEEFMDAVWMITRTAPAKPAAPVKPAAFAEAVPSERRFLRAALVNADLLMRSLGRPNREQVVTTRPDQLTTLEALDLSNGHILADELSRGADNILAANPKATAGELVRRVYLQALCRMPTGEELRIGSEMIGSKPNRDSLADLLWAVVMLPEFQVIR